MLSMKLFTEKIVRIRNLFLKYTLYYLFLLTVFSLAFLLVYSYASGVLQQNTITSSLNSLKHSSEIIDIRIRELDLNANAIAGNTDISYFNNASMASGLDFDKLRGLNVKLPEYGGNDTFILNTYIYFFNSNVLISHNIKSTRPENIYLSQFYYRNLDFDDWRDKILESQRYYVKLWPSSEFFCDSKDYKVLTYMNYIPYDTIFKPKAVLITLINEKQFIKMLNVFNLEEGGWCYISDPSGVCLSSVNNSAGPIPQNISLDGKEGIKRINDGNNDMVVIYTTSSYSNWKYVAAIHMNSLMQNVNRIQKIMLFIFLGMLLLGVILSIVLARRSSAPIMKIQKKLSFLFEKENNKAKSEFDFINGSISNLMESNLKMKNTMQKQLIMLQSAFFEKLLKHGFYTEEEIKLAMESIDLELKGCFFYVIIIRIVGFGDPITADFISDLNKAHIVVIEAVQQSIHAKNTYVHNVENDKVALLLSTDETDESRVHTSIEELLGQVEVIVNQYNINMLFGVGSQSVNFIGIASSFDDAAKALEYCSMNGRRIVYATGGINLASGYFFPVQLENQLINLAKRGDLASVKLTLDEIHHKNFSDRKLTSADACELIQELRGTLLKLKEEIHKLDYPSVQELEEMINSLNQKRPFTEIYDIIRNIFYYICHCISAKKQSCNKLLMDEILGFLNREYKNKELCLYMIASRFNLTEKYLSRFFREQTGVNFVNYLENLRINCAIELLKTTAHSVNEISDMSGYQNVNTFYKAFKRVYGISPTTYRENNGALNILGGAHRNSVQF